MHKETHFKTAYVLQPKPTLLVLMNNVFIISSLYVYLVHPTGKIKKQEIRNMVAVNKLQGNGRKKIEGRKQE
jgi:hypothetical protein